MRRKTNGNGSGGGDGKDVDDDDIYDASCAANVFDA